MILLLSSGSLFIYPLSIYHAQKPNQACHTCIVTFVRPRARTVELEAIQYIIIHPSVYYNLPIYQWPESDNHFYLVCVCHLGILCTNRIKSFQSHQCELPILGAIQAISIRLPKTVTKSFPADTVTVWLP